MPAPSRCSTAACPSFAVDTDGTLHTALMRSCTGWPSGIWIDEPRRTAPDGSNFQLQHWTHVFDYALVSGDGDWRHAADPDAQCAILPSAARRRLRPGRGNGWRRSGSLLHVEPADSVHLGALKAAGNPLAAGSAEPVDPGAVALRLVETTGTRHPRRHRLRAGQGARAAARRPAGKAAGEPGTRKRSVDLHGYQVATVLARLEIPDGWTRRTAALAPHAEAAQPLYARYWLHNRGPAPLGGLPAVAHLHPQSADRRAGRRGGAAAHRGQRLQRCRRWAARSRWCARTAGRPHPPSCRSRWAAANTGRPTSC